MRLPLTAALSLILTIALAPDVYAAKKDKTRGLPAASNVPEANAQPLQEAKSKLAVAQGKVERAQDAQATLLAKLRAQAEAAPAVAQAQADLKQAQYDYDAASAPALERARATREHQAALDAKKAASQTVLDLQAQSGTPQDDITQAARAVLEKGQAATRIEAAALASDAKVAPLKARLDAANGNLLKARHAQEQSIKSSPDLDAAKKEVEQAQAELPPLRSAVSSAQQKYNADLAAREKALSAPKSDGGAAAGASDSPKPKMKRPRTKKKA